MRRVSVFALGMAFSGIAAATPNGSWEVKVTNLTPGQSFTPLIAFTHARGYSMFQLGAPADEALEAMAEGGDTSGIAADAEEFTSDVQHHDALLGPGETVTFTMRGQVRRGRLSLAGMLLPTNDNFVAVNGVLCRRPAPRRS